MADNSKDLVAKLPGSSRGDKDHVGVTNHVLMPKPGKAPGQSPPAQKSSAIPAPHLLGSGSKIPQSQEARMRSQFASPDPKIYDQKRRREAETSSGSWWHERPAPIGLTPYRSDVGDVNVDSKGKVISTIRAEKLQASKTAAAAAKEQAHAKSERKKMEGMKEAMLGQLCTDPTATASAPETQRIVNIVVNINKKLGLPAYHSNHWKLPDT